MSETVNQPLLYGSIGGYSSPGCLGDALVVVMLQHTTQFADIGKSQSADVCKIAKSADVSKHFGGNFMSTSAWWHLFEL